MGTELQSKQLPADDYSMSDHTRRTSTRSSSTSPTWRTAAPSSWWPRTAPLLEAFAFTLLENEVLEREDIDRIVAAYRVDSGAGRGAAGAGRGQPGPRDDRGRRGHGSARRLRLAHHLDSRPVFERIDHIGVAVADLDAAIELYRDRLGHAAPAPRDGGAVRRRGRAARHRRGPRGAAQPHGSRERASAASSSATARACTTWPTRPTTSTPRWTRPRAAGLQLIDEEPRTGIRNSRVAFLHPKSTGGVLTELVEPAEEH